MTNLKPIYIKICYIFSFIDYGPCVGAILKLKTDVYLMKTYDESLAELLQKQNVPSRH